MSRSTTPAGPGPATTTGDPAISGAGSGMGAAAGPTVAAGVQAGTVNDAAQGTGAAAGPSLGSGMALPERDGRTGAAATGGAPGLAQAGGGAAAREPFGLPYKVTASPGRDR